MTNKAFEMNFEYFALFTEKLVLSEATVNSIPARTGSNSFCWTHRLQIDKQIDDNLAYPIGRRIWK